MILLVDDKSENLFSLSAQLKQYKYSVDTALSGAEALKKTLKATYDLIILDVQMPQMDGFDVAEALSGNSKTREIPIIFLTANYIDKAFIEKGYRYGAVDYITKPVDIDILVLRIRAIYTLHEQMRNISEMKMALEKEVLERKFAEQKKDELLALTSHELKTPLTSIRGYHELVRKFLGRDDDLSRKFLRTEAIHIARLSSLVNNLLDYSAIENGIFKLQKEYFSLSDVQEQATTLIKDLYPSCVVSTEDEARHTVYADRRRIEQVMLGFLSNAVKFSMDKCEIVVSCLIESDKLTWSVKDYGPGIASDKLELIFDKYYRGESDVFRFPGLGIGLYLCRTIVERHGGTCWAESNLGNGSTFFFTLPTSMA